MVDIGKAHKELVIQLNPGSREAFQAMTLVAQFHKRVNSAVTSIWGHAAAEPVTLPPSITRSDSSSTADSGSSKVRYLEKAKLPVFCGDVTK